MQQPMQQPVPEMQQMDGAMQGSETQRADGVDPSLM
jgi:hypothetical protein